MMYILYIVTFIRNIRKPSGTYLAEVESVSRMVGLGRR